MPYGNVNTNRTGIYSRIKAYDVTPREPLEPINAQKYIFITTIYVFVIAIKSCFRYSTVSFEETNTQR